MSELTLTRVARRAMGTRFEVALWGECAPALRAAGEEALAEVARLEAQLSAFDPRSELSAVNARAAARAVPIEPRFFALLTEAVALAAATGGAFDPTIAPLMHAWGLATGDGRVPTDAEIADTLERVGAPRLGLDRAARSVRFERAGMRLDLGGIGKGYAIDRAVEMLRDAGVASALIHGGTSTAYGLGHPPDEDAWRVAIRDPSNESAPLRVATLEDAALSVSAGHGKSFTVDGRTYGHVIDPRDGRPLAEGGAALAAVVGPRATATDALATALLVLGEAGLAAVAAWGEGYAALAVLSDRRVVVAPDGPPWDDIAREWAPPRHRGADDLGSRE